MHEDAAQELKDVETPKDIPDDAREGLVLTLDKLIGLPDDGDAVDLMEVLDFTEDRESQDDGVRGLPQGHLSLPRRYCRLTRTCGPSGWSCEGQGDPPEPMLGEEMKLGLVAASLVLVAGGAVGCGDDGGDCGSAKKDERASTADFCLAFEAYADDLEDVTGQEANLGEILKKAAKRIEDVGTPEDIPDDAKAGPPADSRRHRWTCPTTRRSRTWRASRTTSPKTTRRRPTPSASTWRRPARTSVTAASPRDTDSAAATAVTRRQQGQA